MGLGQESEFRRKQLKMQETDTMRIGYGCDLHRLAEKRKLRLCGVEIPFEKGLLGHSNADVAVHALIDALLGALALGDIGSFFPDSDPLYKDADSMELLKQILAHDAFRNWTLVNADLSILAQKPKLAPHIGEMRQSLADALGVDCSRISVKAKTAEGLGDIGEGRAMEARAVVLLRRK